MRLYLLHLKRNILVYILIGLFGFLFFYHLDYSTLESWDEAWYGSIASEIVRTGNTMQLNWNGILFVDHPPMGFWLMALSQKIFGVSEFGTRFPSAFLGLLTIILTYKIGDELFKNKNVGFAGALILGTCVWYILRVRSGNLDAIFLFFYALTVYLALLSSRNIVFFPLVGLAFAALILSKTLIGASAIVLIFLTNLKHLLNLKKTWVYILAGIVLFIGIAYPWYYLHIKEDPLFIEYHFFKIGTRGSSLASYFDLDPAPKVFFFLRMGMRVWFYLWIAALGYLLVGRRFFRKQVFFLVIWNFMLIFPFLSGRETELWHLIPAYLPAALVIGYGFYDAVIWGSTFLKKYVATQTKRRSFLLNDKTAAILYLGVFSLLAAFQVSNFWQEIMPRYRYMPDQVDISKRVSKYGGKIFLDDDFFPISVFYSGKRILPMNALAKFDESDDKNTLVGLFRNEQEEFVAISRNWAVENLRNEDLAYEILEKNDSFSIVTRPDK